MNSSFHHESGSNAGVNNQSKPRKNVIGRISKVTTKFAFIATEELGSVFCPLAASIPQEDYCPDMLQRYNITDVVRVEAVRQGGKNECNWRAVKMRHVRDAMEDKRLLLSGFGAPPNYNGHRKEPMSSTGFENLDWNAEHLAIVDKVSESYGYALTEFGSVFVPGGAFNREEVTRLNSDLLPGEKIMVRVQPQLEISGCRLRAVSASTIENKNAPYERCVNGNGRIVALTDLDAIVFSKEHGKIVCTMLTWSGGDTGKSVNSLKLLLKQGDAVIFRAALREPSGPLWATRWSAPGFTVQRPKAVQCDSYTQTLDSDEQLTIRALRNTLNQVNPEQTTSVQLLEKIENVLGLFGF